MRKDKRFLIFNFSQTLTDKEFKTTWIPKYTTVCEWNISNVYFLILFVIIFPNVFKNVNSISHRKKKRACYGKKEMF